MACGNLVIEEREVLLLGISVFVHERCYVGLHGNSVYVYDSDYRLNQQAALLGQQMHDREEELLKLEAESERLGEDMKQVIQYSHMEKLTQELVDVLL